MLIHAIGDGGYWTGATRAIGERDGAPSGWTRTPVPALQAGEYARWAADGWEITTEPYLPPVPPIDPTPFLQAGAARRERQFRKALRDDPVAALVQRAQETR